MNVIVPMIPLRVEKATGIFPVTETGDPGRRRYD